MASEADKMTIDDAAEWIAKAEQLGYYSPNVARLLRAGVEAVRSVLHQDIDDRKVVSVEQDLDALYSRLVNKSGNISAATAQTYITRTRRLLADYRAWLKDARSFKPTVRRAARTAAKRGRGGRAPTPAAQQDEDWPADTELGAPPPPGASPYRDHTLSLSTGKAYLRVPASLSAEDVALLTLVIRSHGPTATADPPSTA